MGIWGTLSLSVCNILLTINNPEPLNNSAKRTVRASCNSIWKMWVGHAVWFSTCERTQRQNTGSVNVQQPSSDSNRELLLHFVETFHDILLTSALPGPSHLDVGTAITSDWLIDWLTDRCLYWLIKVSRLQIWRCQIKQSLMNSCSLQRQTKKATIAFIT